MIRRVVWFDIEPGSHVCPPDGRKARFCSNRWMVYTDMMPFKGKPVGMMSCRCCDQAWSLI